MTWTYTKDPSTSDRDALRFLIGDTDENDPQMEDEEVDYLLVTFGSPQSAAVGAARRLSAKYARMADKEIGDLRIYLSQRARAYADLVSTLGEEASGAGGALVPTPYAGGSADDERFVYGQTDIA